MRFLTTVLFRRTVHFRRTLHFVERLEKQSETLSQWLRSENQRTSYQNATESVFLATIVRVTCQLFGHGKFCYVNVGQPSSRKCRKRAGRGRVKMWRRKTNCEEVELGAGVGKLAPCSESSSDIKLE